MPTHIFSSMEFSCIAKDFDYENYRNAWSIVYGADKVPTVDEKAYLMLKDVFHYLMEKSFNHASSLQ